VRSLRSTIIWNTTSQKPENMSKQIPQPPKSLFLGNVAEIDPERSLDSFVHLADKYGPVYRLDVLGKSIVVLSSQELVDEACDSKHFEKFVGASQIHLRPLTGDGLFTADNDAPVRVVGKS
jgi:cytochrome P450 / NADPH-cytochrome P450 reductase